MPDPTKTRSAMDLLELMRDELQHQISLRADDAPGDRDIADRLVEEATDLLENGPAPSCWGVRDDGVYVKVVNLEASLDQWPAGDGRVHVPLFEHPTEPFDAKIKAILDELEKAESEVYSKPYYTYIQAKRALDSHRHAALTKLRKLVD